MQKQKYCTLFIAHFLKGSTETLHEKYGVKLQPLFVTRFLNGDMEVIKLPNPSFQNKCKHGEMAIFLGLPDYNSVDKIVDIK